MSVVQGYVGSTVDVVKSVRTRWPLLTALASRDISDEYVQHRFSILWNFIQPLFLMAVYLLMFTVIWPTRVQAPNGSGADAVVYLLAGILPWLTLQNAVGRAQSAIVNNSNIVKQMAFPLELLPLKSLVTPMLFMGVSLAFIVIYSIVVTGGALIPAYIIGLPVIIVISLATFAGLALLLSATQVFLRDTKEFVSMFLTVGLFLHPILYLPEAIPEAVRGVIYASPFTYLIFCWRDVLFYGAIVHPVSWVVATLFAGVIFVLGARLFMGAKQHFGDFL